MSITDRLVKAIRASDEEGFQRLLDTATDPEPLNVSNVYWSSNVDLWGHANSYMTDMITLLSLACELKKEPFVATLLEKAADANLMSKRMSRCPIHFAVLKESGNVNCVKILHRYGANLNVSDTFKRTPLHYACLYDHVEVVEFLLEHEVQLDVVDIQTDTALTYAIYNKNKYLIQKLITAGCDVNIPDGKPIEKLVYMGSEFKDCIELLIKHGLLDMYKEQWFDRACFNNIIYLMHILKPTHKQLNDATTGYCSALYTACDNYGDATSEVVTLLLDWGASVNGIVISLP